MKNKIENKPAKHVEGWLQRIIGKFSVKTQRVVFILAIFFAAVYCGMLVGGFNESHISITKISFPFTRSDDKAILTGKVKRLKFYLDSLSASQEGRLKLDSIIRSNPGLIDSLKKWEKDINRLP